MNHRVISPFHPYGLLQDIMISNMSYQSYEIFTVIYSILEKNLAYFSRNTTVERRGKCHPAV